MSSELLPYARKGIWRRKGRQPDVMLNPIRISPKLAEQLSKLRAPEDKVLDRELAEVEERAIEAARANIARPWTWLNL